MRSFLASLIVILAAAGATAQTSDANGWALISVGGIAAQPGGRIAFAGDGAVFGSTGCNRFSGQAVAAPGVVTFAKPLATTKMACPGAMGEQERQVLDALQGTLAVAFDPVTDRMMLIPSGTAPVLGFARDE